MSPLTDGAFIYFYVLENLEEEGEKKNKENIVADPLFYISLKEVDQINNHMEFVHFHEEIVFCMLKILIIWGRYKH